MEKYARKGLSYWRAHGTEAFVLQDCRETSFPEGSPDGIREMVPSPCGGRKKNWSGREKKFLLISRSSGIVVPLYNTPEPFCRHSSIRSTAPDLRENMSFVLSERGAPTEETAAFVEGRYGSDRRVRLKHLKMYGVFPRIPMLPPSVWPPASF